MFAKECGPFNSLYIILNGSPLWAEVNKHSEAATVLAALICDLTSIATASATLYRLLLLHLKSIQKIKAAGDLKRSGRLQHYGLLHTNQCHYLIMVLPPWFSLDCGCTGHTSMQVSWRTDSHDGQSWTTSLIEHCSMAHVQWRASSSGQWYTRWMAHKHRPLMLLHQCCALHFLRRDALMKKWWSGVITSKPPKQRQTRWTWI